MDLSFWEKETYFNHFDVAIIGSGIVGLSTAFYLKKKAPRLKVVVLERGILPTGASSKNAGFACFGSPSELLDDLDHLPEAEVYGLVARRWQGLQKLRQNLGDKALRYKGWGGYEVFGDEQLFQTCADRLPELNRALAPIIGHPQVYERADEEIKKFGLEEVRHLIRNRHEGQLDTGEMILNLTRLVQRLGVIVLTGVNVERVEETGQGVSLEARGNFCVQARQVLVATNGFARQLLPSLEVAPARAQVLITAPIPKLRLKGTFHYDRGYYYFRNIGQRVLLGGGRNLDFAAEETATPGLTEKVQESLEKLLQTVILPGIPYRVEHRWSGIMGLGPSKATLIKPVSASVYCAVRMGGMGVAIGILVGEEAADMLLQGR
ncbi:FAD-dependent oxidoreductase [soil metagenome]